ncbi:MAG: hypothetical protein WBM07_01035 [Chitinivibrionales bacterium]
MKLDKTNIWLLCIVGILICTMGASADYVEGVDTTDVNGYGLDSTFHVIGDSIFGENIINFCSAGRDAGYFNYSFDDIKMAPDSNKLPYSNIPYLNKNLQYCFVTKNNKDNIYSKIQILKYLANERYVFKYGTNTTPNNRMLIKADYDRSVKYKPNNFYCNFGNGSLWDPPLPNNNHLIGYMIYVTPWSIDTTTPINLAQWDSIRFTTSTTASWWTELQYVNIVAVYAEGKSDFLKGWTLFVEVGVKQNLQSTEKSKNTLVVKKASDGYLISPPSSSPSNLIKSLSIYNAIGKKISMISSINKNQVFWKTSNRNIPERLYIARLELLDKTSCSRAFILSSR